MLLSPGCTEEVTATLDLTAAAHSTGGIFELPQRRQEIFGGPQIRRSKAFCEPIVDGRQYSSRLVMSTLGHMPARETQRSAQLQGESPLSPGQAECGRKALLRAGPRPTNRLPKQQLTFEAQQFGIVGALSPTVGTRQPLSTAARASATCPSSARPSAMAPMNSGYQIGQPALSQNSSSVRNRADPCANSPRMTNNFPRRHRPNIPQNGAFRLVAISSNIVIDWSAVPRSPVISAISHTATRSASPIDNGKFVRCASSRLSRA